MASSPAPSSRKARFAAAALLLAVGVSFAAWQLARFRPPKPDDEFARVGPIGVTREERDSFREQMMGSLDLTPEQREQIEKLAPPMEEFSFEGMRERRAAVEAVLTPEQREKAHAAMRSMMRERMEKDLARLPEQEREKFLAKLEDRMRNGPPGGPGGPPPEGGPPE